MLLQAITPVLSYDSDEECGSPSSSISGFSDSLGDFPQAQAPTKSPPLVLGFDEALDTLSAAFCDDVRRKDVPEPPPKKCHPVYYFEDGSLELLVEGMHYNVHRSMIKRHAPSWLATLDLTPGTKALSGVTCEELNSLLAILYPGSCAQWALVSYKEWTAVLRLATMWSFTTVRVLAIRELDPLATVIDKLVLARAHEVEQWLRPAFVELCLRSAKLVRSEAARLQAHPDDVVLVFTVREEIKEGRLPREEAIMSDRVDAWLTGKTFEFPVPKTESNTVPQTKTASVLPPQRPTQKAVSSSSSDEPPRPIIPSASSSVPTADAPVPSRRSFWQSVAEPPRARIPSATPSVKPTKSSMLESTILPARDARESVSWVAASASPASPPVVSAQEALESTSKWRFDAAVRLITTDNASEFVVFVVSQLEKTQPSTQNRWRIDLHRDFTRSLLRHTVRTKAFVPVCADVLTKIANGMTSDIRDKPLSSFRGTQFDPTDWSGPRLGRSRARRDIGGALDVWRSFLEDGSQEMEEAEILKYENKSVADDTYKRRGEILERLGKALIANGLLEESDVDPEE